MRKRFAEGVRWRWGRGGGSGGSSAIHFGNNYHHYVGAHIDHEVINHAIEYVRGHVHTNGIENFWSLLRRTLGGTYVRVEPLHLQAYIHEHIFRFNLRSRADEKITNADRFALALTNVAGQRLTWKELTGKEAAPAF